MIKIEFTIGLVLCANGVPVGARISRDRPLPPYQTSYEDTPEGRSLAEHDLARIRKYIEEYESRK